MPELVRIQQHMVIPTVCATPNQQPSWHGGMVGSLDGTWYQMMSWNEMTYYHLPPPAVEVVFLTIALF